MMAAIPSSRLALATLVAALVWLPGRACAQSSGAATNAGRTNARIGNFNGGHLSASSFGDGSAPAPQPPGINANPSGFGSPMFNNPPGGGFLGRYGAGDFGAQGANSQAAGPENTFSRATVDSNRFGPADGGTTSGQPDESIPPFPRRVGNTSTRQWEIGANLAGDGSYGYWANWGTNMGLLMKFGVGYPFLAMGMGGMGGMGMMPPGPYGWDGYGPPPAYGYGGILPGPNEPGACPPAPAPDEPPRPGEPLNGTPQPKPPEPAPAAGSEDPQPQQGDSAEAREQVRINVEKGELRFRSRDYRSAAYYWKHASAGDPQNGVLKMMRAQALLANGQFNAAATATRDAMQLLPESQWGVVVTNRRELYGEPRDYLDQLLALDKAAKANPADPALRFLAGFHYAYLGYPKAAVDNFDKGLKLSPQDELALKLRNDMQARLTPAPPPAE